MARTPQFSEFLGLLSSSVHASSSTTPSSILDVSSALRPPVPDALTALISKLGENIVLSRLQVVAAPAGGVLGAYTHRLGTDPRAGRVASVVAIEGGAVPAALADKIAQHVSGVDPGPAGEETLRALAAQPFLFDPSGATIATGTWPVSLPLN